MWANMITIVLNAYNDERKLVCQLIQKINNDENPDWVTVEQQYLEQLNSEEI